MDLERGSYHRASSVKDAAQALKGTLEPLSAYSPDLMPEVFHWH